MCCNHAMQEYKRETQSFPFFTLDKKKIEEINNIVPGGERARAHTQYSKAASHAARFAVYACVRVC